MSFNPAVRPIPAISSIRRLALCLVWMLTLCLAQAEPSTDSENRTILPEIEQLKDFDVIPPQVYDHYPSRQIGEAIVHRLIRTRQDPAKREPYSYYEIQRFAFDPMSDATVQLYFPVGLIGQIAARGFLNLHQAPPIDNVVARAKLRSGIDDNLANLKLEADYHYDQTKKCNYVRPKSAMLDVDLPAKVECRIIGGVSLGDAVAVMRPQVMRRCTVTPFDSSVLDFTIRQTLEHPERLRKDVRVLLEPWIWVQGPVTTYYEAQIWGAVDLRDVSRILVKEACIESHRTALESTGLPVWSYREAVEHDRYRRLPDRCLIPGNPRRYRARCAALAAAAAP